MCRFQCDQQCCPSKQTYTAKDKLKTEEQQQFTRNKNVKFFSPDSSDESEDDEHHHHHDNHHMLRTKTSLSNYNFLQSCEDNFFRSFDAIKSADNFCHENSDSSLSLSSATTEEEDSEEYNSQQSDSEEDSSKTTSSSIDGSTTARKLKSILSTKACQFWVRWGMQLTSFRTIPNRFADLFFDELELDFNEVNFSDNTSYFWCQSLQQQRNNLQNWSLDEQEEIAC
ncbi:hypothetical protein niasHT_039904 [Heterodera trifolii]|uniref:Uncharacterized protein n=1 Tax=Heterodera trifolii TaxID=157864 RepID=A0ABD2IF06_9BILA